VGGEAASKDIGGFSLESNLLTVLKEAATEFRADAVEFVVQKEPADSAGQPQPRYMRRLTDEAVRLLDDLRSGKLESGEFHPERMLQRSRQRVLYDQSAAQARRLCREH
jgi:hypothetical protein